MKNVRNEFTIHNWNSAKESVFHFFGGLKRVKMHAKRYWSDGNRNFLIWRPRKESDSSASLKIWLFFAFFELFKLLIESYEFFIILQFDSS